MSFLSIIFILGSLGVGILTGMILELLIDNSTIEALREQNHRLKLENTQLRSEAKPQTIEVLDRRSIEAGELFKPF